jgi:hypothetical protein
MRRTDLDDSTLAQYDQGRYETIRYYNTLYSTRNTTRVYTALEYLTHDLD